MDYKILQTKLHGLFTTFNKGRSLLQQYHCISVGFFVKLIVKCAFKPYYFVTTPTIKYLMIMYIITIPYSGFLMQTQTVAK